MTLGPESNNKAKVAKRVVEVLEFFDEDHPQATVMDLVRRYKWPQSSTSELLSSLVDLGLLYKDGAARTYSLTPRAAMLGSVTQPDIVRDGRLTRAIERLAAQTGLGVGVFGVVGLNAQVFNWRAGARSAKSHAAAFGGGALERLNETAAGWLLLSTVPAPQRDGMLRRLNAEAPATRKFNPSDVCARVQECRNQGVAVGPAGYGSNAQIAAALLSLAGDDRPMALGIVYDSGDQVDTASLAQCLQEAVLRCLSEGEQSVSAAIRPLVTAA